MSFSYFPAKEEAFKIFTRVQDFIGNIAYDSIKLTRSQLKILWEIADETDEDADYITIFQKTNTLDVLAYGSEESMPIRVEGSTSKYNSKLDISSDSD